ncbi:hypothetical protein L1987_30250 [Smallanthus sonchifolius]|uniref:Uncharacterized protein n=1 Tax=Smallanthus sonchifolius TaxID=185202 RepID=A0ACB9I282_9ASTR|nr:hypothetical protein L1987_30250 [Smallanthus sonchifolius]
MKSLKIGCNHEMVYNLKPREFGGGQHQPWQVGLITVLPSEVVNQKEQGFSHNGVRQSFNEDTDVSSVPQMRFNHFVHPKENGYFSSYDRSYKMRCSNESENDQIIELKRKLLDESDVFHEGNQYLGSGHSTRTSDQVSLKGANHESVVPSKTRIRWTQDLHDRFVECVNCLGGSESTFDLYKYRIAKYLPESAKGNSEKKTSINTISQIENITGMQFKDALQMQLAVQRQLHDQLEIQRNLQLRIEEQAKQLKKMFDQHHQQKTNRSESSEITFSHDDHHSTNLDDDEILNFEDDSENTLSLSKIS